MKSVTINGVPEKGMKYTTEIESPTLSLFLILLLPDSVVSAHLLCC